MKPTPFAYSRSLLDRKAEGRVVVGCARSANHLGPLPLALDINHARFGLSVPWEAAERAAAGLQAKLDALRRDAQQQQAKLTRKVASLEAEAEALREEQSRRWWNKKT